MIPDAHSPSPSLRVAVVGSLNMDLVIRSARLPRRGQTVIGRESAEIPGGKGANQAVAAARLGAKVSMIGRVGADGFGNRLRAELQAQGVNVDHVLATPDCASGLAIVAVEDSGENAITVVPGANGRLSPQDVAQAAAVICGADVLLVQLETPLDTIAAAVELARRQGVLTILDPAPAPAVFPDALFPIDVVCPNESEAAALTSFSIQGPDDAYRAAIELRGRGAKHALITLGARGAIVCSDGATCQTISAFAVQAVDSTAAGDAFAAALGVRLAMGSETESAVRFACAAGALAASKIGAQPAMPTLPEVIELLRCDTASKLQD